MSLKKAAKRYNLETRRLDKFLDNTEKGGFEITQWLRRQIILDKLTSEIIEQLEMVYPQNNLSFPRRQTINMTQQKHPQ